jgi:hypothetical protein
MWSAKGLVGRSGSSVSGIHPKAMVVPAVAESRGEFAGSRTLGYLWVAYGPARAYSSVRQRCSARSRPSPIAPEPDRARERASDVVRLRCDRHWVGVRRQRVRAAADGEGLQGRGAGGRTAIRHARRQTGIGGGGPGKSSTVPRGWRTAAWCAAQDVVADLPVPLGRPGDDGSGRAPRWAKFVGYAARHPWDLIRLANLRHWSERTVIALVMQTRDNSITVRLRRGVFGRGLRAGRGHGEPSPTWIPARTRRPECWPRRPPTSA